MSTEIFIVNEDDENTAEDEKDEQIQQIECETIEEADFEMKSGKEKSKRYERSFKISWEYDKRFTIWLIRSPNNLPFCKFCGVELKASGGTQDLKYHMKTRKHLKNSEAFYVPEPDDTNDSSCISESTTKNSRPKQNLAPEFYDMDENDSANDEMEIKRNCKICGDHIISKKSLRELDKIINIRQEKKMIQLEMKKIIEEIDLKENIESKTPIESFVNMLSSDMSKLPDSAQRKLRMNIMQMVDKELLKIESK